MSANAPIMLRWRTADVAAATARLAGLGFTFRGSMLCFSGGVVVIEVASGLRTDRLALAEHAPAPRADLCAGVPPHANGLERMIAVGWATVDLERAATAFGSLVEELVADPLLGARVARLGPVDSPIVLLEPITEGRLAATLARSGEGPAALYLAPRGAHLPDRRPAAADGPFGPGALLDPAAVQGPHLIACPGRGGPSDTIAR